MTRRLPVVIVIVGVVLMLTAVLRGGDAEAVTDRGVVPAGWTTHSAYGLQLSVPRAWHVSYFSPCPFGQLPGTLTIGPPRFIANCPAFGFDQHEVMMSIAPTEATDLHVIRRMTVHGVHVEVVQKRGPSPKGILWFVPSKDVLISGYGSAAHRILNTLAPTSRSSLPAPGIVNGTAQLAGLPTGPLPISGSIQYEAIYPPNVIHPSPARAVQAVDGHYTLTLMPGRYRFWAFAGDAPCPPVTMVVVGGVIQSAPTITCNGL
jgi:hypothetical protein